MTSDDIAEIAQVLTTAGRAAAQPLVEAIAWSPGPPRQTLVVSTSLRADTYCRDHFTCRYCGRRTVLASVLELIARIFPAQIPFESHHYRGGVTHPAFTTLTASVDHIRPVSGGGAATDPGNLVTACWPCNLGKGDLSLEFLGWTLRPIVDSEWAGLTGYYAALWRLAERPNPPLHLGWMRALGIEP